VTGDAGDVRRRLLGRNEVGFFEPRFRLITPTSVGELEPGSSLITALGELGIDPGVDCHSIIPSCVTDMGDGIVPLASARLKGVASELVVRAQHACLEEREVVRKMARILAEHIRVSGKDSSHLVLGVAEPRGESWANGQSGSETPTTEGMP
jgi:hypothetical protein